VLKTNPAVKLTILATILSLLFALTLATTLLGSYSDNLQHYLNTLVPKTLLGALTFILLLTPALAIGLPRQIAAISAGFLFGAGYGTLLATMSTVLGCMLTMLLARKLFANIIQQHYPIPLAKVNYFFSRNTFLKALIIRLLPAGSNFLTNILAGTARSPFKAYVIGSTLGFIPQMTIFSLMGAGLQIGGQQQLILSIILFVIAIMLSGYLYRKTHHNLSLR
jgi:uncharacterized membrane protein YdjX (TVP38/TMEM64 family)